MRWAFASHFCLFGLMHPVRPSTPCLSELYRSQAFTSSQSFMPETRSSEVLARLLEVDQCILRLKRVVENRVRLKSAGSWTSAPCIGISDCCHLLCSPRSTSGAPWEQ